MKWLGLTGGIASGKSTVAKILRELSVPVVDADELSRQAVRPGTAGLKKIKSQFGAIILNSDGTLNRGALGKIVFGSQEKLHLLEAILHPEIQELRAQERRRLEREGTLIAFYDVPLLFEKICKANSTP
jgi:dephospho-CoA kinase